MEIKVHLSEKDLNKLEEFRNTFIEEAKRKGDEYLIDLWSQASIEKLASFYLSMKLQNW